MFGRESFSVGGPRGVSLDPGDVRRGLRGSWGIVRCALVLAGERPHSLRRSPSRVRLE